MDDTYTLFSTDAPDGSLIITVMFKSSMDRHSLRTCYRQIASTTTPKKMAIVLQRIWGDFAFRDEVLMQSTAVFPNAVPPVFLKGASVYGSNTAGIQIRAVPAECAQGIDTNGHRAGMRWQVGDDHFALLTGLWGDGESPEAQTRSLLRRAKLLIENAGFRTGDIIRTWFYLDHILDWYDEFNAVRTAMYTDWGLVPTAGDDRLKLPASTGIGVCNGFGKAVSADVYLAKQKSSVTTQLSNTGQKEAYQYGSAFSRGALLSFESGTLLELSGTAAIDEAGETVFREDAAAQIECTLNKVKSLLIPNNLRLHHLAGGVAFFKDAKMANALDAALVKLGIDPASLPVIRVVADVCRDDLLFELDGELVTKAVAKPVGS